jgi:hypothetical protein
MHTGSRKCSHKDRKKGGFISTIITRWHNSKLEKVYAYTVKQYYSGSERKRQRGRGVAQATLCVVRTTFHTFIPHFRWIYDVCRLLYSKGRCTTDNTVATAVYTTLLRPREKHMCTSYNAPYKYNWKLKSYKKNYKFLCSQNAKDLLSLNLGVVDKELTIPLLGFCCVFS